MITETAAELANRVIPPVTWCVEGLLPVGVSVLCGKPKVGKSWLALQMAFGVAHSGDFLGYRVERGEALFLALNDMEQRMQSRVMLLTNGAPGPNDLRFAFEYPADPAFESLGVWLDGHPSCRLVVFDSGMPLFRDSKATVISSLRELAVQYNVAILLVMYARKAAPRGSDFVDCVIGSAAIVGSADSMFVLERLGEDGMLRVTGREIDDVNVSLRQKDGAWFRSDDFVFEWLLDFARRHNPWAGLTSDLAEQMRSATGSDVTAVLFGRSMSSAENRLRAAGVQIDRNRSAAGTLVRLAYRQQEAPVANEVWGHGEPPPLAVLGHHISEAEARDRIQSEADDAEQAMQEAAFREGADYSEPIPEGSMDDEEAS